MGENLRERKFQDYEINWLERSKKKKFNDKQLKNLQGYYRHQ